MKTCTKCGNSLPQTADFFSRQRDGRHGLRADCKQCHGAQNRAAQHKRYAVQRAERIAHPAPVDTSAWGACPYCGDLMRPRRVQCGKLECHRMYQAQRCRSFTADYAKRYPDKRRAGRRRRRALERGCETEMVSPLEIYERDEWLCRLCGGPVPKDARFPDRLSATLDHIVPLSRGGSHTKANLQLAHLSCNCSARAKEAVA